MSETLDIVQELYEAKYLSYPRTDSAHITKDEAGRFPQLLAAIKNIPDVSTYIEPILNDTQSLKNSK